MDTTIDHTEFMNYLNCGRRLVRYLYQENYFLATHCVFTSLGGHVSNVIIALENDLNWVPGISDRKIKFQKSVKNSTLVWLSRKSAESGSIYLTLVWCILFGEQCCVLLSNRVNTQSYFST